MDLKFTHIFGPLLVIVAFLIFGRGIVNRTRGKDFRPLPAFILLLVAVAYRFVMPKESLVEAYSFVHASGNSFDMFLDRITLALMDFGIGMCIDSGYLAYKKHNSKLFWVPGVLALVLSTAIYLFAAFIEKIADGIRDNSTDVELLVELGPDDHIGEIEGILVKYRANHEKTFRDVDPEIDFLLDGPQSKNLSQYYSVFVDPDWADPLVKELRNDRENVDHVDINHKMDLIKPLESELFPANNSTFVADDPQLDQQWYAPMLDYNGVHTMLKGLKPKRKAVVAIVDTGVDSDHEDLNGVFKKSRGDSDEHSHGTHCAGLAGAETNNGKGVGSLNWEGEYIKISGYPALNKNGWGTDRTVAQAIIDAANGDADVISMSLGGPGSPSKAQKQAVEYALKKGAIVIVAAGNSNRDAKNFTPASIDGVIVVSAVDQGLNKASFSNTNTSLKMPIAAPGVDIMSSIPGSKYQKYSGTSMATPIVSGLVGVLKSFNPDLTPQQAHELLVKTGKQVKDSERVGLVIQPKAAIEAVVPVPAIN